jgi:hypothetical protein
MTNNPLIAKWEELHNPKKEEPKKVEYELAPEFVKQLENRFTLPTDPTTKKLPSLITYDVDSGKDSFLQIAEKIKNGKAKVSSVSINADAVGGFNTGLRTYTFEVMDWDI